jgi:AcrR family transcriptional regulator
MYTTKEKILDVSLELFSQRGYSAVSIRDICKGVGIKESSVYYHFENKQSIFDVLLDRFSEIAKGMMAQLENGFTKGQNSFSDGINTLSTCFFEQYLMNDFCNRVMRIMFIEQFNNEDVRELYQNWMMDEPLNFQKKIFSVLMSIGIIQNCDSEYLAVKYYAPIYFYAQKWLFNGELTEESKEAFRIDAYKHIQMFFGEIGGYNG